MGHFARGSSSPSARRDGVHYKVITRVPKGVDVLFRMNELRPELRFLALKPHCIGGVLGSRISVFKVPFDI